MMQTCQPTLVCLQQIILPLKTQNTSYQYTYTYKYKYKIQIEIKSTGANTNNVDLPVNPRLPAANHPPAEDTKYKLPVHTQIQI